MRARASSATWTAQFASSPSFDDGAQRQNLVHGSPVYSFSLLRELPQRGPLYCTGAAPRRAPPPCCLRQPNPPRWPAAAAVLLDTASLPFAGRGGGQGKKRRQPPPRALCTARPAGSRVRAAGRRPLSSRAAIWFPLPSPATPAPSPPTAASIPTAPRRRQPGSLAGRLGFPASLPFQRPARLASHGWKGTTPDAPTAAQHPVQSVPPPAPPHPPRALPLSFHVSSRHTQRVSSSHRPDLVSLPVSCPRRLGSRRSRLARARGGGVGAGGEKGG